MRLYLTLISVIMIFMENTHSKKTQIKDCSEKCVDNRTIFTYLTSGVGRTDSSISMIATIEMLNCTLAYSVRSKNYLMAVIQFPDWKPNEKVCSNDKNYVYMVSNAGKINVCQYLETTKKTIYFDTAKSALNMHILSDGTLNTIKITVTAMREPPSSNCDTGTEIKCIYKNKIYCMNHKVRCDGNINCGLIGQYDEDIRDCQGPTLTPRIIICSILMGIITFWLVISITIRMLPKRKETFVYKFDQTMSLFDNEENCINVEINIQTVFPAEGKIETMHLIKKKKDNVEKSNPLKK